MKYFIYIAMILMMGTLMSSCASVPMYQRMYVNDKDMDLQKNDITYFETSFQTYREGPSGANGGKGGGGCGCN